MSKIRKRFIRIWLNTVKCLYLARNEVETSWVPGLQKFLRRLVARERKPSVARWRHYPAPNSDSFRAVLRDWFCAMGSWQRLLLFGGVSLAGSGGACTQFVGRGVSVCRRQVRDTGGRREKGGTEMLGLQGLWCLRIHCLLPKTRQSPSWAPAYLAVRTPVGRTFPLSRQPLSIIRGVDAHETDG